MKTFRLTVNGQSLTFTEDQIPEMQGALEEAVSKPGVVALRSGDFGEIQAHLESPTDKNNRMTNRNIQLTDC
jgi:hypothetical protein